jgi:serine/threonine protein kinase
MRTQTPATESDARAIGNFVEWPNAEISSVWRFVARLGRGGTAEVWHARAPDGREAALKLASPALRGHPVVNAALRHEYDVLRAVASPHLVEPYELLEPAGSVVLVLEYLPHGDLVPLIGGEPQHWLPAVRRVLAALMDLHRHGFGHGDVKAANVLFASDGTARLADLTSARPIDAPAVAATAAHELPAGSPALVRDADCFAFAVLLFQLVSGRLPYGPAGSTDLAAIAAVPSVHADSSAASLLCATQAALRAGGCVRGLSYFVDVLVSVRPMDG